MNSKRKSKHQAQTSRLKEESQQDSSASKLSYLEKRWFYSLGGFDQYQPAFHLYKHLKQMDSDDQQLIMQMQTLDQIHQRFEKLQQPEQTKWYHAAIFINTWFGFVLANTLLDPVKAVIFETIKAATPFLGEAAQDFLKLTAKVWKAVVREFRR